MNFKNQIKMKKISLTTVSSITARRLAGIFLLSSFISLTTGCKKDPVDPRPHYYTLGEQYGGGIVFYVDSTQQHGLIAATVDQSITAPWWNGTFVATNATSTSDGFTNTQKIVAAQQSGEYAASICDRYAGGGLTDWFLPSKDQLDKLYSNRMFVGGFSNEIYWSSTEFDVASVWVQDFTNGQQHLDNSSDGANVHTRAIRAF